VVVGIVVGGGVVGSAVWVAVLVGLGRIVGVWRTAVGVEGGEVLVASAWVAVGVLSLMALAGDWQLTNMSITPTNNQLQ
jgi:hypothetical protein